MTLAALLGATAVALLLRVEIDRGPPEGEFLRFEPRIPGSVCIWDPIVRGVDALVQSDRSKGATRVQVRWLMATDSSSGTQRLSRDLRQKGFRVSARAEGPSQTNVAAVRTERQTRAHLRVVAKTVNATAVRASSEVLWVESPAGGCAGKHVPTT